METYLILEPTQVFLHLLRGQYDIALVEELLQKLVLAIFASVPKVVVVVTLRLGELSRPPRGVGHVLPPRLRPRLAAREEVLQLKGHATMHSNEQNHVLPQQRSSSAACLCGRRRRLQDRDVLSCHEMESG